MTFIDLDKPIIKHRERYNGGIDKEGSPHQEY